MCWPNWMDKLLRPAMAIAALLVLACSTSPSAAEESYTITLVRHAEKAAGGFDPDLTDYGRARAEFFADWITGQNVQAVWSSDFKRTRNTVKPLAHRLGLEIRIYDPRDQASLMEELLAAELNAVVAGHSNTIPALAAMLCECEVVPMEDTDYERSFWILKAGHATGFSEIDLRQTWTDRPVVGK